MTTTGAAGDHRLALSLQKLMRYQETKNNPGFLAWLHFYNHTSYLCVPISCSSLYKTSVAPSRVSFAPIHWFAICFQSTWTCCAYPTLLCMLFLLGWPPCQRSDLTLMEVSSHAYISLLIRSILLFVFLLKHVNLIWCMYLIVLNELCLSLESKSAFSHSGNHMYTLVASFTNMV